MATLIENACTSKLEIVKFVVVSKKKLLPILLCCGFIYLLREILNYFVIEFYFYLIEFPK